MSAREPRMIDSPRRIIAQREIIRAIPLVRIRTVSCKSDEYEKRRVEHIATSRYLPALRIEIMRA